MVRGGSSGRGVYANFCLVEGIWDDCILEDERHFEHVKQHADVEVIWMFKVFC